MHNASAISGRLKVDPLTLVVHNEGSQRFIDGIRIWKPLFQGRIQHLGRGRWHRLT
jgi:hypothetical protein